jgi:hypothetical protein
MSDDNDTEEPEDESPAGEVPEGAAVFPLIPAELGVNPLLLAVLHATVFLAGSEKEVVDPAAAQEAMEYLAGYLQRLEGDALARVREDIACLIAFARQEKWDKQSIQTLKSLLDNFGVGEAEEAN